MDLDWCLLFSAEGCGRCSASRSWRTRVSNILCKVKIKVMRVWVILSRRWFTILSYKDATYLWLKSNRERIMPWRNFPLVSPPLFLASSFFSLLILSCLPPLHSCLFRFLPYLFCLLSLTFATSLSLSPLISSLSFLFSSYLLSHLWFSSLFRLFSFSFSLSSLLLFIFPCLIPPFYICKERRNGYVIVSCTGL